MPTKGFVNQFKNTKRQFCDRNERFRLKKNQRDLERRQANPKTKKK
jgi:hypothetical protein